MELDLSEPYVSIDVLRAELPSWKWKAVRNGMQWYYAGEKAERFVIVHSKASMHDDGTYWYVREGCQEHVYYTWRQAELSSKPKTDAEP